VYRGVWKLVSIRVDYRHYEPVVVGYQQRCHRVSSVAGQQLYKRTPNTKSCLARTACSAAVSFLTISVGPIFSQSTETILAKYSALVEL